MQVNITMALFFSLLVFATNALAQGYYGSDYYVGYRDRGYLIMTPVGPQYLACETIPCYRDDRGYRDRGYTIMTPAGPRYLACDTIPCYREQTRYWLPR